MSFRTLFAAGAAVAFVAACPIVAAAKHAYISPYNDTGVYSSIGFLGSTVAFPIVDGHIASVPDRTYPGHTEGPLALDASGRLYAAMIECRVAVFAPNSTTIERKIEIESVEACGDFFTYTSITALAVDRSGDLFVSLTPECCNSAKPAHPAVTAKSQSSGYPCGSDIASCTLVYGPNASGHARPLQVIDPWIYNDALATDGAGNLYMHESSNKIDVVADPTTNPRHVRSIVPGGFDRATNPIIDEFGQLYLQVADCTDQFGCLPGVAVFDDTANGRLAPKRHFELPLSEGWAAIAISDAALYALTGGATVEAFHKHATGQTLPLFSSLLPPMPEFPAYMVVGP